LTINVGHALAAARLVELAIVLALSIIPIHSSTVSTTLFLSLFSFFFYFLSPLFFVVALPFPAFLSSYLAPMSAPSPHPPLLSHAHDKSPSKRKDRPPALEILDTSAPSHPPDRHPSPDDTMSHLEQVMAPLSSSHITLLTMSQLHADQPVDDLHMHLPSRSTSATSSLDPYYFSVHSPSGSPAPLLLDPAQSRRTPETRQVTNDPVTPHRDPSKIDRRVLHGLGELATPRWSRSVANREDGVHALDQDDLEPALPEEPEDVLSDSPWTIEAVDDEEEDEERDEVHFFRILPSAV
jgi:dual specificity tyrosine-phosphorylation-regulated kinase 2/3/4